MAQVKTNKKQVIETQKSETQKSETQKSETQKSENLQVIEDLQKQVLALEAKQKQKIENLKNRVNANTSLQVINKYIETNKQFTLKPCNNEYHKIFVKYDNKNCMFLLVKSDNKITFYTKTKIQGFEGIENNTYPKQYPHRVTLATSDLTGDLLNNIFNEAKNNINIKVDNKQTIAELKKQITELQAGKN